VENTISREAVGGSLESFQPRFTGIGIGTTETFSKLKFPPKTNFGANSKDWTKAHLDQAKNNLSVVDHAYHKALFVVRKPRMLVHATAMVVVAAVVVGAQLGSVTARADIVSQLGHNSGYGAVLDSTVSAEVAAKVAENTGLLVTAEATQKASNLTSQVALAGTDDALAKRQVVSTTQTVRHDISTYVVKPGDTLSNIATDFGVTTNTLKWANSIDDETAIRAGQTLKILPVTGVLYTVKAGDTPGSIASKFQAVEAQLVEYNDLDVKSLAVGKEIIVPDGQIVEAPKVKATAAVAVTPSSGSFRAIGSGSGYPWGQCTYHVAEMIPGLPGAAGNAWQWRWSLAPYGWKYTNIPSAGAIAYTPYGWGGSGHVAFVRSVNADGSVTISERNYNGNPNITFRTISPGQMGYLVR
jgi:surface antigen